MTAPTLSTARATTAEQVIRALAGPQATLRDDQQHAVAALCEPGARVLVVQATGWGKSAVYWAATLIRRAEGAGPTLVVSPLLALMRDQVEAAGRAGLRAATLNSANVDEWSSIEGRVRADEVDVLLVSPERLANPTFGDRVLSLLTGRLGMLVIDEAHAVSDWGHDFRPDYRRVADVLRGLDPRTPVLATTATANARVTADLADQLGAATVVLRGPLARTSLQLVSIDGLDPLERYAWVLDNLPRLPGSGIVYTLTVADAERLAGVLAQHSERLGPVRCYTGALAAEDRAAVERQLRRNEVKVVVATSALGMGFDKPDLGFVVHVGAPPTPVAYYQQVGRAGRGLDHAPAVLLSSRSDEPVWDYFITATVPDPEQVRVLLQALTTANASGGPASVPALEAASGVRRGRVDLLLKQLAVERVVDRVDGGWVATGAPWQFDADRYDAVVAGRRREADLMRAYARGEQCLMMLLQRALDDPGAAPCGRCSACLSAVPEPLSADVDPETVRAVATRLRGDVQAVEPRKMWPGGAWGSRGRIPAGELAEPGRAVAFASAPEWAQLVSRTFAQDAAADEELVDAAVRVLAGWRDGWVARPQVMVSLPAAGFDTLTRTLTERLAAIGRVPAHHLVVEGRPREGELTSADEAVRWREALTLPADLVGRLEGRPVLLVVDRTSRLWPVTVATALLRRAGAGPVLPLVVHREP
ncbi:MAG TPA: DEAD/DEAH box helicase [Nocardioidaceae bacterium]|nr:DEAD/DEAH box helicase [Nocardioidaceae bacterium]